MPVQVNKVVPPQPRTRQQAAPVKQPTTLLSLMLRKPLLTFVAIVLVAIFSEQILHTIQAIIIAVLPGLVQVAIFVFGGLWVIKKLASLLR